MPRNLTGFFNGSLDLVVGLRSDRPWAGHVHALMILSLERGLGGGPLSMVTEMAFYLCEIAPCP